MFERKIASLLRERWPDAVVRRANQTEKAYESDVFFEEGTSLLKALWLECNDAIAPNPLVKLLQAERDISLLKDGRTRHAVVVWHKKRCRDIHVTLRYKDLVHISEGRHCACYSKEVLVTMLFEDFFDKVLR